MRVRWLQYAFVVFAAGGLFLSAGAPSHAHWFTKLLKEAGEAGQDAATTAPRLGISALDEATAVLRRLPVTGEARLAFAAHATPEGHWKFTNRDGAVFTAATPDEMGRVTKTLAPDAPEGQSLSLYLSSDTVFLKPELISNLPEGARLYVVLQKQSFPLVRLSGGSPHNLYARVRPHVLARVGERAAFKEAVWQLERQLPRGKVRVLSLRPGGAASLAPKPRLDKSSGLPVADDVDPGRLAEALPSIGGQTALVTGRVDGDLLHVLPATGGAQTLSLTALRETAKRADINLVVLHAAKPLQPGGQNWLWQTIEVGGLSDALARPTFGDFLDALAGGRGQFKVSANIPSEGRVLIEAMPDTSGRDLVDSVGTWVGDAVSDVAGHVVTESVSAFMTSEARQRELDQRIVPGIPSDIQFYYIGALVMGVFGWSVASGWWRVIWPREERGEYRGSFGFDAARVVRGLVFVFVFLPIVGPFALLAMLLLQLMNILFMPVRFVQRLFGYGQA
jgi:hypothetical protein